jgi:Skp family chaperone for outer membrane proteins
MKRVALTLLFLVAVVASAGAQSAAPAAEEILPRIRDNQKQLENRRKDYICDLEEETQKLDDRGAIKKTEVKGYEMFFMNGEPILRQVSNAGKPLAADEQRKQQEDFEKQIKKARERAAKRERNEDDPNALGIKQFLAASRFSNGRYDSHDGQRVIAYDFQPNTDFKPHTRAESLANKLSGTVWIDPDALQIVRLEARVVNDFKVGGGVLGSLHRDSAVVFEQKQINGEIWLPSLADFKVGARLLLFKSLHERVVDRFSNYRKFRVSSTISVEGESK